MNGPVCAVYRKTAGCPQTLGGTGTHITFSFRETKLPLSVGRFEFFWVTWPNHTLLKMQCVRFE